MVSARLKWGQGIRAGHQDRNWQLAAAAMYTGPRGFPIGALREFNERSVVPTPLGSRSPNEGRARVA